MSRQKQLYKIIILGDSGYSRKDMSNEPVIKDAYARYVNQKFTQNYRATVGADFMAKEVTVDDRDITLQIWDTAGQERFKSLGSAFYKGADCCVLVFDITNPQSFKSLEKWQTQFFTQGSCREPSKFPFVILGNKCDRASERLVQTEMGVQWQSKGSNITYFQTSAKDATNIDKAFIAIAKAAISNDTNDLNMNQKFVTLNKKVTPAQKKKCCL